MKLKRSSIAFLFVLVFTQRIVLGVECAYCDYDDPLDAVAPAYDPLAAGDYEIGQTSPLVTGSAGAGPSVIPIDPGSWSLVVMPDTQFYSQDYPQYFTAQTQWIKNNAAGQNIKYVLHEGDIVNVAADTTQWANSRVSLDVLNGAVPYALAPGNHDYGGQGNDRTTLFNDANKYGPGTPYASQPSIGGFYEPGKTDNSWHTFSAGGKEWLVIATEWGPRDAVVQWANQVVAAHPDDNAILVTHAYMYYDDTIYDWATKGTSQSWNPHSYGIQSLPGGVNDGEELWDKLVKLYGNFKFVFNGHVLGDGAGMRSTLGDNGNVVHQILANYQMNVQGGQGDMRVLEFKPDGETVVVRTYSPVLDRYNTAADQQFTLNMNQIPEPPPPILHAVPANLIAAGPTDPSTNTVDSVTVPQSSSPGVGLGQLNRGDYQVTVNGSHVTYTEGIMLASLSQHERSDFTVSPGVYRRASVEVGRNSFGDGNLALSIMEAGSAPVASMNEVNWNTSVAWFPFGSGFRGAHVNGTTGVLPTGGYNGVAQSMVARTGVGRYTVNLGVNSQTDGMLFTIGNNNENVVVQAGPAANGAYWDIRVEPNSVNHAATGSDKDWSFLYLPYQTPGLIGGYYDGFTNTNLHAAGSFTMTRLATGQYQLTVPGQTSDSGMLIMSIAYEATASGVTAPDDNILTYATGSSGTFTINSYDLPALGFQDTKFVWAFLSFDAPLAPLIMPGDFNRDALVDQYDYLIWKSQYGKASGYLQADGNGDGVVDSSDYVIWRKGFAVNGSGANAAEVPEPQLASLALSAVLLVFCTTLRRLARVLSHSGTA